MQYNDAILQVYDWRSRIGRSQPGHIYMIVIDVVKTGSLLDKESAYENIWEVL